MIKNSNEIKAFDIYKRSTYLPGEKLFELVFLSLVLQNISSLCRPKPNRVSESEHYGFLP